MTDSTARSNRRAFLTQGSAALAAGVAATAGVTALASDGAMPRQSELEQLKRQVAAAQDRDAIRQLQRTFLSTPGLPQSLLAPYRRAYRPDTRRMDTLTLSDDGLQASCTLHVEAEVCTPLQGDSTIAAMARLQGNVAASRWEAGRLDITYLKTAGVWHAATLAYTSHHTDGDSQHE
jgi:hypothetical protein